MNEIIEVGLIGYGMAGKVFHAPLLHYIEGFRISMIKTSREEDIATAKLKYSDALIVPDVQPILLEKNISLIVIATPNGTHYELAKRALLAGKHVVVDKPFTITSAEAEELIKIAKEHNRILSVYHNRRWDSDFRTVEKLLASGVLGKIVSYEAHFDRFRNVLKQNAWKEEDLPGSGILYDLGSHLIDQALFLFGKPESVSADIRIQRDGGKAADYFFLQLFYSDCVVKLTAGMLVKCPAVKFIVTGRSGTFVKYGMDVQEEALKNGITPQTLQIWGEEPETLWGSLDTNFNYLRFKGKLESERGDYFQYYKNVRDAILHAAPLAVTADAAKSVIEVIELALKSSAEKRTVNIKEINQSHLQKNN